MPLQLFDRKSSKMKMVIISKFEHLNNKPKCLRLQVKKESSNPVRLEEVKRLASPLHNGSYVLFVRAQDNQLSSWDRTVSDKLELVSTSVVVLSV
jgi:hypothetical protein